MSVSESLLCLTLYDPMDYTVHGILQARRLPTGIGSLSLLQGIVPTQGLNSGLLYCRQTLPTELSVGSFSFNKLEFI